MNLLKRDVHLDSSGQTGYQLVGVVEDQLTITITELTDPSVAHIAGIDTNQNGKKPWKELAPHPNPLSSPFPANRLFTRRRFFHITILD